jgi:hypothetical protein
MFIPPQKIQKQLQSSLEKKSKVYLKSSHLQIDRKIVEEIFGSDRNVNMVYYADRKALMIAPVSDELFKKLHKAKQHMLKDKNANGDKTIALHELLIDNEINDTERDLEFEIQKELKILNVTL